MTDFRVCSQTNSLHQDSDVSFLKITRITKSTSELFTWVVLLDPHGALLANLFGFLGKDSVLEVCSVETHGEPKKT